MFLVISAASFAPSSIFFGASVKNHIIEKGLFTRLLYSTQLFTTNGLYLKDFTRQQLKRIENDILTAHSTEKVKCCSLASVPSAFWAGRVLTISGVWETETTIGLAFKFVKLS